MFYLVIGNANVFEIAQIQLSSWQCVIQAAIVFSKKKLKEFLPRVAIFGIKFSGIAIVMKIFL